MPERLPRWLLVLLLLIPVAVTPLYLFVCDDAFISFRYVRNLVDGHGLVWNVGERVEGYTNFLWVLMLAGVWAVLGVVPEQSSVALSLLFTVGTGALVLVAARQTPQPERRAAVALLALLLWATNRSVWVWSTSGLETRQFTFFVTLAWVLAARWADGARYVAWASAALGLAALCRPEGMLTGPLLLGTFGAHALFTRRLTPAMVAGGLLPFAAIVGGHLLWRHSYYGDWLPNTYYAKHVRPWWDAGARFYGVIAIEHALWLVGPLALVGMRARWKAGSAAHVAAFAWAVPEAVHLARIGGDHFEFRMMDAVWPPLYVAAAEGVVALVLRLPDARRTLAYRLASATLLVYGLAIPVAHDLSAFQRGGRGETGRMKVELTPSSAPWVWALPPNALWMSSYHAWQFWCVDHSILSRHREHQDFARLMRSWFEEIKPWSTAGIWPADAVSAESSIGVYGYFLADLPVIDKKGLTDATVARHEVTTPNAQRQMAHDRSPPPGYLESRGYNLEVDPVQHSQLAALKRAPYALRLDDRVWVPLKTPNPDWLEAAFAGRDVHRRDELDDPFRGDVGAASTPSVTHDGQTFTVRQTLASFDDGPDGWTLDGLAFAGNPTRGAWVGQDSLKGFVGRGLLNSFHPTRLDAATGTATSPAFIAQPGDHLAVRLGGKGTLTVLADDDTTLATLKAGGGTTLAEQVLDLAPWTGQPLRLRLTDDHARTMVLLDDVRLVQGQPPPR